MEGQKKLSWLPIESSLCLHWIRPQQGTVILENAVALPLRGNPRCNPTLGGRRTRPALAGWASIEYVTVLMGRAQSTTWKQLVHTQSCVLTRTVSIPGSTEPVQIPRSSKALMSQTRYTDIPRQPIFELRCLTWLISRTAPSQTFPRARCTRPEPLRGTALCRLLLSRHRTWASPNRAMVVRWCDSKDTFARTERNGWLMGGWKKTRAHRDAGHEAGLRFFREVLAGGNFEEAWERGSSWSAMARYRRWKNPWG